MSALDKIRQAFPELENASDSEVLGEAARRTGVSVAQLSDTLGIAPSGAFGEAARQLYTGLTVDAPRMAGQALKYYGDAGGERVGEGAFPRLGRATGLERQYGVEVTEPSPAYRAGQALVESADIRGRGMDPDLRGRGLLGEAVITGARGLGGVAPALGLMALPGGQVLAPAVQAALFGGSSAQDTYEKLIEQGIPESEAAAAARRVWGVQGVGEGVATAGVGALLRPAMAAVRGARTTEGVAKAATDTGVLRPFAKGMALNVPLQAGTEAAQDVGTSLIERSYGAAPEDLGDIARGSALAGAGMTLLLGPLALGGSVTRARRAQSLKDALYNPDTPVETRAKAMDLVMGEARRQGVAEQDVDTWFNQQLELEDARTEALRVAEQEEKTKQINLLGEKAQELEGLQGGVFSSLDQQRAFEQGLAGVQVDTPFASIDQQRAFTQGLETARDNNIARVGQQYQDLMGDRASTLMQAQDIGQQAQSVLEPQQRGLAAATQAGEQWQEVRAGQYRTMMDIDDMGQEWQKLSKELPQPVTGELSRAQKAALRGPEGKRFKPTSSPFVPTGQGPASTTLLEPVQNTLPSQLPAPTPAPSSLLSERPVEPVTPPGAADAVAAALPAAPVAAGVSSTPGAPSGTQASQTVKAETKKQAAPAIRIASTQTAEQQAKDDLGLTAALQVANRTKSTGNPLQASVEGAGKVSVPGKTSLNIKSLRDIRDALLNPSATVDGIGAKEQRIANAVRAFAKAYYKFSNAGGNMLRGIPSERGTRAENGEMVYKATKFAGQTPAQQRGQIKAKTGGQVNTLLKNLNTTRTALNELAAAVGGNAKDVEAIVKLVKDMVQQKLHTQVNDTGINEDFGQKETEREDGKDPTDIAFGKLDTMLSQGWNAAKANMFQGESDAMFVRQTAIRNSAEATAAGEGQSPLEKAAEGYAVFGKGESSDGLLGVMNYIQTHGTPFERTIAKAVFESMAYQDQPKLVFITDGKPRFDPKTNTVYIQRDASAAVTLHEALHSALQWYVYQNPDAPEVRALKAALKKVVAYKGPLNADAKRVQDLLKELVKGKKEIDAVLELVSYGNTLNDFRRALEAMESTETPKSFFDAASNVWQSILTAVQKMLGVKPSVASDVIANTFKLLEAAGQRGLKKGKPVGNALEAAVTADAESRFNPEEINKLREQQYKDRKKLIDMNIDDFLALAKFGRTEPKLEATRDILSRGGQFSSLPYLSVDEDGKVSGHEGRHRARALKEAGYKTMPVVLHSENIRWSEQADPEKFDYVEKWPNRLVAQSGAAFESFSIPFPVSREQAGANYGEAAQSGNVLEAAIQSGDTPVVSGTAIPSKEADAITGQFQNPLTAEQYKKLSTTLLPEQISSKFLFDMFGWAKVPGKAEGAARKVSDYIQKNHTGAAKVASWVNSHFGLQSGVRDALIRAKDDKRGGSMIYNQIAQYFTSLPPQESVAVLEYMDAKLANLRKQGPAPAFPNNDTQMKDLADATITKWWEYARALRDPKQRDAYAGTEQPGGRWTGGVKFSQGLAFAESVDQLASASFGVRNISQLISSRTKNEVNDDAITFRTDANGDAVLDDKFVGMYLLTPALKKRLDNTKTTAEASQILAELMPDEFISSAKLTTDGKPMVNAEGVQLIPDRNYLWDLKEKEKGGYKFTARLDAKQALLVKKGRDLGHALQNTMAILANSYSANRLTEALVEYEAKTPNAVSFDTLDDLNAMLNGEYKGDKFVPNTEAASWTTRVKQNQVVKLSDSEAKSERVKGLFRNRNQWVQLPNGPTYGALAGKIVNGSVWSAIEDMSDRRPLVNSAVYNGTMRWFKKAKTVYNPATWGTNVASNFTMAMLDDIPLPTIGYAAKLYVGYMLPPAMASKLGISLSREQQQLMLEIMKTNALLGDFSSTELKQSIYDSMRSTIGDTEQGVAERVMQFAKMEKDRIEAIKKYAGKGADAAERADQLLGDWYSMQDNIFRVASMLNNLGQQSQAGKAIDGEAYRRAGDHARFAFLDYDIDSKAIRIMRQTAFPFISWPYAAAKMIGNVAVHKPWKLVNLYAGLWILDGLTQAITGDDDDELRESGPEWARNRMLFGMGPHTHIRVPFMGDSENPVYYDIGKYITPSSFGDRIPNAFLGLSWWPSFVSPGGPYISSAIALIGGVDPYTGRALSPPTADDWEKLSARLTYGQSLFAPNLPFLNARELTKAQEAFTATEGRSENYSSLYMARTAGLRLYDFNVQGALDQQDRAAAAIEREYKTEIGKLKRKMERLETPDWDEFFAREEELVRRMEERIAKVRGGQTEEE
jgi:hypothetical protein